MKTIFIPIFQGQQARNILRTDVFLKLQETHDVRLVIFTKPEKVSFYQQEYGNDRVIIEGVNFPNWSNLEKRFQNLCLIAIDTDTIKLRQLRALYQGRNFLFYIIKRLVTKIFGQLKFLQHLLRVFDDKYFYNLSLETFFLKYRPDLVFCPNISGRFDLLFIKTSKRLKVKTVGLVNSWDNLSSRGLLRCFPDQLLVHNEEIKNDAVIIQGFSRNKITICGIPHFDYYVKDKRSIKDNFYNKVGIRMGKEILLFCPAGSRMNQTEWQVIKMLDEAICTGKINFPAHILIRRPPNADMVMGDLVENENITFDNMSQRFETNDPNDWEWSEEDMIHLADSIFYSRVVINYASTISIDAVAFNKPVINIAFDGWENLGPVDSFTWFYYKTTHYKKIIASGGVGMAYDINDLINMINEYYRRPHHNEEGRLSIIRSQVWCLDGKSSDRMSNFLLNSLSVS